MSDLLKINSCVYSRKGLEREKNRDDFYMNGRFLSENHLDNTEALLENRANEFFFAIADHMEYSHDEQKIKFSILREIGKFHEKITVQGGDIEFKNEEITTRLSESVKYLNSIHDLNGIPEDDAERQSGFAGLLLTEGKAIPYAYGNCHFYFCRAGEFKHIATGFSKSKRLTEMGIISDEEAIELGDETQENEDESIVLSLEPIELLEGDKFLLISDGVFNALGEEYIEDILSLRSDSTYIAYKIITEATKVNSADDMTAMVVRIERIKSSATTRKPAERRTPERKPVNRPKASALKNVPPPTYKYNKKNISKYENIIYYVSVVITAILLILIMLLVIRNIMKGLNEPADVGVEPTPVATLTPVPTPPDDTIEVTPEPTPTVTAAPVQVKEHTVKPGDTLTSIVKIYYGDNYDYVEKLGKYNNIPAPYNTIVIDQKIKIPPLEELLKVE